ELDPMLPARTDAPRAERIAAQAERLGDRELAGWALAEAGIARRRGGDYAAAEAALQRAYAIATEIHSASLQAFVLCERSRAAKSDGLLVLAGRLDDAEQVARAAVDIAEATLGPASPNYGLALDALATVFDERSDAKAALPLRKRILAITRADAAGRDTTNTV